MLFPEVDKYFENYKNKYRNETISLFESDSREFPNAQSKAKLNPNLSKDCSQGNGIMNTMEPKKVDFTEDVNIVYNENDISEIEINEKIIFLILFRRLSNADFVTLFKLFALYTNSVVTYLGKISVYIML